MGLQDFEASTVEQCIPLRDGSLLRPQSGHHRQVQLGSLPRHILIGQHHLVDENARVSVHGGDKVSQNWQALLVRVVMQYVARVIELGAWRMCEQARRPCVRGVRMYL